MLVACPGRLADLLRQGALKLDDVEVVVIDEADRMADMGFLPEVRRLLDQTPKSRQTLLFSATLDGAIKVLTRDYQQNAAHHEAGGAEPDGRGAHHVFWRVDGPERAAVIAELVPAAGPTIVFCRTRRGADRLTTQLERAGVRAAAIHGGRSQNQRDRALSAFKVGNVEALIATDVAARGIHVDGVACVLHYDTPEDGKAYLHRSGRTARAGATGLVVSLVGNGDTRTVARMQRQLEIPAPMTPPNFAAIAGTIDAMPVRVAPSVSLDRMREERSSKPEPRRQQPRRNSNRSSAQNARRRSTEPQPVREPPRELAIRLFLRQGDPRGNTTQHFWQTRPRDGQGGEGEGQARASRQPLRGGAGTAGSSGGGAQRGRAARPASRPAHGV